MRPVTICDVGPRDGLQNQPVTLEPGVRAELVDRLAATGIPRIEAVSFVNPKLVPQMADAEEVVAALSRREGVVVAGLALNERGYDRLHDSGLDEVHFALAATDEFNRRNAGATVEEGIAAGERIVERAIVDGIRSTVTIGVAFGCPFEGAVDPGRVAELAARFAAAGTDEIVVADTVGVGVPRQARDLVEGSCRSDCRSASTCTTPATTASRTRTPPSRPAPPSSTPPSAASAAARSLPGRRATSRPRIWCTSSTARASRPESISAR